MRQPSLIEERKHQRSLFVKSRYEYWVPELLIFLSAIALYTYQLGTESFWIDEILSVESALGELNLNRPLYFILLRFWMRLGTSDAWLRSLSLLFGLGCIVLTYLLGRSLVNKQTGRIAALLLTLSPLAINHAQEVRFYAMSTCLGLAGSLCLAATIKHSSPPFIRGLGGSPEPQTTERSPSVPLRKGEAGAPTSALLGWILFRCLGFLTAQPNILLLLPDLLLIAWLATRKPPTTQSPDRPKLTRTQLIYWLCALALLFIPTAIILSDVIPEFLTFLSYTSHADTSAKPSIASLIGKLAALTAWPLRGPTFTPGWTQPLYRHLFNLYSVLTIGLLCTGLALSRNRLTRIRESKLIWAALWGFLPILSIFVLAQVHPILWEDRYALISAPYILILLAAIWTQLWQRYRSIALSLALLYLITISGPLARYYTTDYRADWQGLAQQLAQYEQPGDLVIVYPGSFVDIMDYYYDGNTKLLPIDKVITAEDVDLNRIVETALSNTDSRLWVVCPVVEQWQQEKDNLMTQLEQEGLNLQQSFDLTDQWDWGPTLHLLARRTGVKP